MEKEAPSASGLPQLQSPISQTGPGRGGGVQEWEHRRAMDTQNLPTPLKPELGFLYLFYLPGKIYFQKEEAKNKSSDIFDLYGTHRWFSNTKLFTTILLFLQL